MEGDLNGVIAEIDFVLRECGEKDRRAKVENLPDDPDKLRADVLQIVVDCDTMIADYHKLVDREGEHAASLKIKRNIENKMDEGRAVLGKFQEKIKAAQGTMTPQEYDEKQGQHDYLAREINVRLQEALTGQKAMEGAPNLARQMLAQARQQQRDKAAAAGASGAAGPEEAPMTQQEQAFVQTMQDREGQMDLKLDVLSSAVKDIHEVATVIGTELKVQDKIIDQTEKNIDKATSRLKKTNKQLQQLVAESGGMAKWCPVIVCLIVLIAMLALVYNTAKDYIKL